MKAWYVGVSWGWVVRKEAEILIFHSKKLKDNV